jgi:hypothetical protein
MTYVHLANGEVLTVDEKELSKLTDGAAPGTIHRDGKQSQVIGTYPDDVELVETADEKAASEEKAEFEEWKASKSDKTTSKPAQLKEK